MSKIKCFYAALLLLCLPVSLSANDFENVAEQNLKLSITGKQYKLQLKENRDLSKNIAVSNKDLSMQDFAKHYAGEIQGQNNSWYRISKINNHWTGVISLNEHAYVLDEYLDEPQTDSDSDYLQKLLVANDPQDIQMDEPLHCGVKSHKHSVDKHASTVYQSIMASEPVVNDSPKSLVFNDKPEFSKMALTSFCTDLADGVCLLAELEFVFDQLFQSAYPSVAQAQQEALALINVVEGYYFNDFEIKFDTITLEFLTSDVFSTTTDSGDLVSDMQTRKRNGSLGFVKNPRSLLHLVTGRDFDGSTAGTAYVGSLCSNFGFGAGNSQLLTRRGSPNTAITALVVAHELGHNFGSSHDGDGNTCGGGFIMAPSVSSSFTNFSTCTADSFTAEINSISSIAQCFNFPTDISISSDASNPTAVNVGQSIVTDYLVAIDNSSFEQVSSINVNGTMPSGSGSYQAVTVNSTTCSVSGSGRTYSCDLSNLSAPINLSITSMVSDTNFEQSHSVSVAGSGEIIDVKQSNNTVVSNFSVTALPPPDAASSAQASIDTSGSADVVNLSWQDNSNDESGFIIERSVNSGSFSELTQVASNITAYSDAAVNAGESYAYRVLAFNAGGNASASNTVNVTLGIEPNGASNASATLNTSGSTTSVDVTWNDNSNNEDEFIIERSVNSGTFSELARVAGNVVSYSDSSVVASTTYNYRIIATNSTGNATASNETSVTTAAAPSAPTTPPPASDDGGGGSVSIWLLILGVFISLIKIGRPAIFNMIRLKQELSYA